MKRLSTRPVLLLVLLLSSLAATPWQEGGGSDTKLAGYMGDLQRGLRQIGQSAEDDEALQASLGEVCRLQRVVLDAKDELPGSVQALDEKKRAKETIAYRLQMQELLRGLLDLEAAVLAGKAGEVKKAVRNLSKVKGKGHDRFKTE